MNKMKEMKLAVILNVWCDSIEHLRHSIKTIFDHVDIIVIMDQMISNRGESVPKQQLNEYIIELNRVIRMCRRKKVVSRCFIPHTRLQPMKNETEKRSQGMAMALKAGATHFFHMDSDEYHPRFAEAKQQYIDTLCRGSVCPIYTYFKKPTLRLKELDGYFVPFIHRLDKDTRHDMKYPFWVDPTRRVNEANVVQLDIPMHHMSWIRKDIAMKLRNSSAPFDLAGEHFVDYQRDLKAGDFIKCYKQELIEVPDQFNLNQIFE